MGTSQSHTLKTTPQWSAAKKAMTSVVKDQGNAQKQAKLMTAFSSAVGGDLYRGGGRGGSGSFGRAGARALGNIIQFISDVRLSGISVAVDGLGLSQEERPQTPRELIRVLCGLTAANADAFHDDEAAITAQNKLLSKIFADCESLADIETLLREADEDTIDAWIIEFETEYIMEYMGGLFQSHIFDKDANPEIVCNQIKQWLRSELNNRLAEDLHHVNIFSAEGKAYLETLTARILDIWQPQM